MKSAIHLTAALGLILINIYSASGLKCHVCSSTVSGQDDCFVVEPQDTKYLVECAGPNNGSCRIQDQWVDFEVLGQPPTKRVIRQCAQTPFDPQRPCYYRAGFGGKTNVCNCLGDGCNGAAGLYALSSVAAAALSLFVCRMLYL